MSDQYKHGDKVPSEVLATRLDELSKAVTEVPQSSGEGEEMNEWQPIETAPKNPAGQAEGPWILVWYKYDRLIYAARWGFVGRTGVWLSSIAICGDQGGRLTRQHDITHWMPLPAPPSAREES
jgi:hypothetical protein